MICWITLRGSAAGSAAAAIDHRVWPGWTTTCRHAPADRGRARAGRGPRRPPRPARQQSAAAAASAASDRRPASDAAPAAGQPHRPAPRRPPAPAVSGRAGLTARAPAAGAADPGPRGPPPGTVAGSTGSRPPPGRQLPDRCSAHAGGRRRGGDARREPRLLFRAARSPRPPAAGAAGGSAPGAAAGHRAERRGLRRWAGPPGRRPFRPGDRPQLHRWPPLISAHAGLPRRMPFDLPAVLSIHRSIERSCTVQFLSQGYDTFGSVEQMFEIQRRQALASAWTRSEHQMPEAHDGAAARTTAGRWWPAARDAHQAPAQATSPKGRPGRKPKGSVPTVVADMPDQPIPTTC